MFFLLFYIEHYLCCHFNKTIDLQSERKFSRSENLMASFVTWTRRLCVNANKFHLEVASTSSRAQREALIVTTSSERPDSTARSTNLPTTWSGGRSDATRPRTRRAGVRTALSVSDKATAAASAGLGPAGTLRSRRGAVISRVQTPGDVAAATLRCSTPPTGL